MATRERPAVDRQTLLALGRPGGTTMKRSLQIRNQKIHYLWWCNCGNKFMTAVDCPINAAPKVNEINWEEMFPPLLVA
jgi:hypothetical protein